MSSVQSHVSCIGHTGLNLIIIWLNILKKSIVIICSSSFSVQVSVDILRGMLNVSAWFVLLLILVKQCPAACQAVNTAVMLAWVKSGKTAFIERVVCSQDRTRVQWHYQPWEPADETQWVMSWWCHNHTSEDLSLVTGSAWHTWQRWSVVTQRTLWSGIVTLGLRQPR